MDPKLEGTVHMELQMLYLHLRSVPSWPVWTASPMVPRCPARKKTSVR